VKLTWFGGTTLRIHIGGEILVCDPDGAPPGVDRGELRSGADRMFGIAKDDPALAKIDPAAWRPRAAARAIDAAAPSAVLLYRLGARSILIDAVGEPPLLLLAEEAPPRLGRWAADAVVVLFHASDALVAAATVLLDVSPPRMIALAVDEAGLDLAVAEIAEHLDGTGLVSLEPGMAVEV
jgi:hypothetical protein